ncbi:hypothetical protein DV738_g4520, partial [Chaetothyriales sp. CBS 135597]
MSRISKEYSTHHEEIDEVMKPEANEINPSFSSKTERETLRKLDILLIPTTCMLYLLAFIDRANLGNARVAGLQTQLGLTDHQYQIALTVTYVPYIVAELPSNLIMKKVGPRYLLPGMCILFGTVTTLQCQVQGFSSLLACRFFLGLFEGGLLPGIILYLSGFYRRHELQVRISIFFSATALSGAFSGLLAAGIVEMDGLGGMEGWRWIFCLEGLFTVLFGIASLFLLPNSPTQVLGFKSQHVQCCEERLLSDIQTRAPESTAFDARKAASAFTSLHVWIVSIVQLSGGTCVFGLAYFTPSIVASLAASMPSKPSRAEIQLLTTPPFVIAFIFAVGTSYISDRYRKRGLTGACVSSLAIIGWALFLTSPPNDVGRRYTALILAITGSYATSPSLFAWTPNNVATHMRRATAIAMNVIATNIGGIISSWLYPRSSAPTYRLANKLNLALSSVAGVGIVVQILLLHYLNEQKKKKRDILLKDVAHLDPHEQYEILGDRHPDFKYTL